MINLRKKFKATANEYKYDYDFISYVKFNKKYY